MAGMVNASLSTRTPSQSKMTSRGEIIGVGTTFSAGARSRWDYRPWVNNTNRSSSLKPTEAQ